MAMKLQADHVEKPLRKLRKQLNGFPSNPRPEDVHTLRTHTRRLEATIAAVGLDQEKKTRRLLKLIKPVRKMAGQVRDMDVLMSDVLTLCGKQGDEPAVRLVQHLAKMRVRNARRLHKVVGKQAVQIRQGLKTSSRMIRKKIKTEADLTSETAPQILMTELRHWPDLDENNLHLFRIRIKELRYMLQLNQQADEKLLQSLGEVKDTIGEWHDWVELEKIARKLLDQQQESVLLKAIEVTRSEKLQAAFAAANRVRHRYFSVAEGRKPAQKIVQIAS